jgi:uncharacterized membrane protein
MPFRKSVFTALLLVSPALAVGQTPAPGVPGAKDFVFFNHAIAGEHIGPVMVSDESVQSARSALNLSEVQVGALKTLMIMRRQNTGQTLQSMHENRRRLEELLTQTNPAAAEIGQAFLAVRSVQEQLKAEVEKFRTDFKALLNADQRAALERLQSAAEQARGLTELGILEGGGFQAVELPIPALPPEGVISAPVGAIGFGYRLSKEN